MGKSENEKSKNGKGCLISSVVIIALIIIVVIAISSSCGKSSSKTSTTSISSQAYASGALSTQSVKKVLSSTSAGSDIKSIKVDNGTVTVLVYDKTILTTKTYLQQNQPRSAEVFQALFSNKSVTSVVYQSEVDVADAYGKTSQVIAQTNTLSRENADKINDWNTFKYESPSQYYSVVNFELAPESQVSGLHSAWSEFYS